MTTNTLSPIPSLDDPTGLLGAWLSELHLSEASKIIYSSMMIKFLSALESADTSLKECAPSDIEAFLEWNKLEKEHRYRYVRLIERFYIYLSARGLLKRENPGSLAAKEGIGKGNNDKTQYLTEEEWRAVSDFVGRPPHRKEKEKEEKNKKPSRHWSQFVEWRLARDKALASVMLFGAVKVSEVALLSVNCTTDGRTIRIRSDGKIPYHEATLLDEGLAGLNAWRSARQDAGIQGDLLFPSSDLGEPMHAASIYRRVHLIAETAILEAGLVAPLSRLSPQTLRNTYARILFQKGFDDKSIMASMGILEKRSLLRLKQALDV